LNSSDAKPSIRTTAANDRDFDGIMVGEKIYKKGIYE
jgi:hypothetical protein